MRKKPTQRQRRPQSLKQPDEEEKAPFKPDKCIKFAKKLSSKQIKKQANRTSTGLVHGQPSSRFDQTGDVIICPVCKRSFEKAQALGGHMSKSHPSHSPDFTRKQLRRKERAPDRERHKRAKQLYISVHGPTKHYLRNKLNSFKNMLREADNAKDSLIDKRADSTHPMTV